MSKMFPVKEVAKRFGKNPATIHRWVKQGHFPGARKNGPGITSAVVIPEDDIIALIEKLNSSITNNSKEK